MDNKISVIIPVYNTAKVLRRCLDSVIYQTYKNLEIILINDGSTDDSLKICQEYSAKDPRIILIDKKNEGGGKARNAGLDRATGEYIAFVDSDDEIDLAMYELMLYNLLKYDAEMCICDYSVGRCNNDYKNIHEEILDNKQLMKELFIDKKVTSHIWRKLYPAKCFKEHRFSDRKVVHDMSLDHLLLKEVNKAVLLDCKLYFYTENYSESLSNTNKWKVDGSYLRGQVIEERIAFADEYYPDLSYYMYPQVTEFYLGSYARMYLNKKNASKDDADKVKHIRNYFHDEKRIYKTDNISKPKQLAAWAIGHNVKPLIWAACKYYQIQTRGMTESIPGRY